jgi:DsbE subfamily thiol:disulfide oxidoreductase
MFILKQAGRMKNFRLIIMAILMVTAFSLLSGYDRVTADEFLPWKLDRIIGTKAPDFTIKNLKGKKVSLASFKGKPVLLNIWATWCPYCRRERAELNELYKRYNEKGLVIISVANDDSVDKVRKYIKKRPADFIVLSDEDGIVTEAYGVYALPTNFLIDRNGIIRQKFTGFRDWTDPESTKLLDGFLK